MKPVALFVREDSIYKTLGVEAWDRVADATRYNGPNPVVAHPPCRAWGCLRKLAKPEPGEKELGIVAVQMVRLWGGVLEHPRGSSLWRHCSLPKPQDVNDGLGCFTLDVDQFWWGHRAQKRTWLYVCGIPRRMVPPYPIRIGKAPCVITNRHGLRAGMSGYRPEVSVVEREATPPDLARWLCILAEQCQKGGVL